MVNNGMVVPPTDTPLPEGVHVDMHMGLAEVPAELTSACAQWDKASDEAWALMEQWEAEEQCGWATCTGVICQLPRVASSGAADPRWFCKRTTTGVICPWSLVCR